MSLDCTFHALGRGKPVSKKSTFCKFLYAYKMPWKVRKMLL